MKHFRQLLNFCVFFFILSASLPAQQKNVTIHIVQEDDVFTSGPGHNSFTLEKKTFRIQVLLQNIKGVYAFTSFKDSLYNLPDNNPVPGFASLAAMTMAEPEHNKEKELIMHEQGWVYWFYDPAVSGHRFNKKIILLDSGRVVGTKTIKQLYVLPGRETLKLKENNLPLYLFFVAVEEEDSKGQPRKELLRYKIKLEWREED